MSAGHDDLSQIHQPVLVSEVLEFLQVGSRKHAQFVDGTVGLGGHTKAILEAEAQAAVLGLDRDEKALALAGRRLDAFGERVRLVHATYADMAQVLEHEALPAPVGVLLDLGLSSLQMDDPERGFSFRYDDASIDMRFDETSGRTAAEFVNHASERDLADALHHLGEEPRARAVARALVRARPITSVGQLREVVARHALRVRRHDPSTRTFQALRMAVNEEIEHLQRGLQVAIDVLAPGGRLVVLAFHSGEERVIKAVFREAAREGRGKILTKKPVRPTDAEVRGNARARPARLRAFERAQDGEERKRP